MQCQHGKLQQLYKMIDEGTSANVAGHGNLNSFASQRLSKDTRLKGGLHLGPKDWRRRDVSRLSIVTPLIIRPELPYIG